MVRLPGLSRFQSEPASPRDITRTNPGGNAGSSGSSAGGVGETGWLMRFFDSSFFCEWIAVSYLYKHEHPGVRDYLCNRMYTLPLPGVESYLFQICYMLVNKPSPSLDKFVIDICSKSLKIALKVHWFLLAELEDSEDSEGISRIQEKCQISATLMGEWPPLLRPQSNPGTHSGSSKMLNRLLSSKQRLLSLTSSPPAGNSPSQEESNTRASSNNSAGTSVHSSPCNNAGNAIGAETSAVSFSSRTNDNGSSTKVLSSPEENNLLRKLIPGPKVRDTLFFRKSSEKGELEDSEKDGFFRRLLKDSKDKEEDCNDTDKEAFFRRFLKDNKGKEEEDADANKEGFFRKLRRDSRDKEEDSADADKEGFFRRLLSKDKEVLRDSKDKESDGTDADKESFFKRLLSKDKEVLRDSRDREEDGADAEKEGFFKRFLSKDKEVLSDSRDREEDGADADKEGFFRRLLSKDKEEDESDKDGFFRKLLRDSKEKTEDDSDKDGFFKRLLRDTKDKDKEVRESIKDKEEEEIDDDGYSKRPHKGDRDDQQEPASNSDGFFKRLFSDKEDKSGQEDEKGGFFKRFFKDKQEEKKDVGDDDNDNEKENKNDEEEESSDFLSFRGLFKLHSEEPKLSHVNENGINGSHTESSPGTENFFRKLFGDRDRSVEDSELFGSKKHKEIPGSPRQQHDKVAKPPLPTTNTISLMRKGTYHDSLEFVQSLCDTSYGLVDIFPIEDRKSALCESLAEMNTHIAEAEKSGGVCFPMGKGIYRVVHIPVEEAILLNSREKAPYMICVEVLKGEAPSHSKDTPDAQKLSRGGIPLANGDAQLPKPPPWAYPLWNLRDPYHSSTDMVLKSTSEAIDQAMAHLWEAKVKFVHVNLSVERKCVNCFHDNVSKEDTGNEDEHVAVSLLAIPGVKMEDVDDQEPPRRKEHRRVPSTIAIEEVKAAAAKGHAPPGLPLKGAGQDSSDAHQKMSDGGPRKATDALSGELWEAKKERIRRSSLYGNLPGWDLRSVIVKSGDDCRQEHLAVQLISHFYDIFQEAGLPLWLRPYEVLVTSSYTALIETIPDTASLHSIKSRFPNITSLRDFFIAKYQENSPNFRLAQRNFVESMAGYSILCYLLQVKDRHNGNLLLDEEGHIIHIDFGFMLSNSPGGVNFESAPFKLTRELLEVMDSDAEGTQSDFFDYFKLLCIQGFLTCRKHAERVILLVEMLQDSGFPCFKAGPRAIENLRKRFHLSLTEEQCVSLVLSLISSSLDAWRTRQYDYYQRVLNGIL